MIGSVCFSREETTLRHASIDGEEGRPEGLQRLSFSPETHQHAKDAVAAPQAEPCHDIVDQILFIVIAFAIVSPLRSPVVLPLSPEYADGDCQHKDVVQEE